MARAERMPSSKTPINVNEPNSPTDAGEEGLSRAGAEPRPGDEDPGARPLAQDRDEPSLEIESKPPVVRGSRWVDYDTHELLQVISDLEDERRWARLREGFWIAILFHLALLSAFTWIPKYVFKVPQVIDPIEAIKNRKDLQYLDLPPDALREVQPKTAVKPIPRKPTVIDKKTLEAMNRPTPPVPAPAPAPAPPTTTPPPVAQPIPPTQQSQVEAPRPAAVPARPNFALGSQNPADQLRDAMKGASRNPGQGSVGNPGPGGLARHPGAGTGGLDVLSDMQGVDFSNWIQRWHHETQNTWDPLIPDEVNPPINKSGIVAVRFKVLPNGRLMDGSLQLEGRSGDTALDRAAWGALTGSNYPPLPKDFHGPYLELRAYFLYNVEPGTR
jgi:outer membrane biosynthesis protein TonB